MDQQLKEVFEMKECNKVLYYEYLLEKLSKKPRIAGYRYHLKLIKKLKKLRVWGILQSKFASCFIGKISVTFKVDRRTLEYWIKKLSENQAWLPDHHKNPAFSRVFTIDQFKTVLALVKITCSQSVIPVTNDQVRIVIQRYYNAQSFHPQPGLHFNASIKFILNLKKILRYSSLRFHPKRRPKHMISTIIDFIIRSRSIFQKKVERNRILNCDESFWRQIEYFSRTWAPTGSDNVSIMTKTDPKSGFTFLATICADGSLLPLVLIASGKTTRVEDNWFGHGRHINEKSNKEEALPNPYYKFSISKRSKTETIIPKSKTDHSEKGWTTNSTFKEYLKFIRSLYPFKEEDKNSRTNRIYLFADTYGAHISEKSINYALDNNVCIVPIPEGCTDIFQPLDLKIFAPMKTKSKKYLEQLISDEIIKNFDFENMNVKKEFTVPAEIDKKTSTALLDIIWYETQRSTVEESWEQAIVQYFTLFNCYNDYDEDKDFEKRLLLREEQRKQEQVRRKYDEKIKNLEKQCSLLICENVKKFFSKKLHECKAQLNSILQPFIKSNKGRKPKKETSNSKNNVTKTVSKKQNNNVIQSSITNQTTDVNSPQEMLLRRAFLIPTFNSSTLSDTQARLQRQSPNTNQATDRSNFRDDNDFDLLNLPLFSNHKNDKKKKTEPFTIRDYNSYITENQIINHKKQLKLIEPMIINELQKENTQYTSIIERTKELRKQQCEQLTNQQLELDKTVREIDQLEHVILSLPKKKEEKTTKAQSKTKRKPKKASSISIIKDPNSLNINSNLPNISSNESSVQIPLNTSLTNTSAVYYNCASQVNNPNI